MKQRSQTTLKPDEREYIAANFKTLGVPAIAKALKRSPATIYQYYAAEGLKPFKMPKTPPGQNHSFRKSNRALESFVIARRIENSKRANKNLK